MKTFVWKDVQIPKLKYFEVFFTRKLYMAKLKYHFENILVELMGFVGRSASLITPTIFPYIY